MIVYSFAISMTLLMLSVQACAPTVKPYSSVPPPTPASKQQGTAGNDDDSSRDPQSDADANQVIPKDSKMDDKGKQPETANDYCKGPLAIVGGTVAAMDDMVTRSTVRLNIGNLFCTGTLIGPNQVVTAAHCVESMPAAASISIEFGILPVPNSGLISNGYSVHPDYQGTGISVNGYEARQLFDVAVITFAGKIPPGYGIAPVGSTAKLAAGTMVTLAGYGAYSDNDRAERPLTFVTKAATFDRTYKEIQLEVGGGKGGCFGDSGGPSYIRSENGMCLLTLSTTTGPGRNSTGACTEGSGTLMDITAYQGWMRCAYEKLGAPLPYLVQDESKSACSRVTIMP